MCVSVQDAGRFTCLAENEAGQASLDMNLIVHGQPLFPRSFTLTTGC